MGNRVCDNDLSFLKVKPSAPAPVPANEESEELEGESKGLDADQKRIHWEGFAQKTARQETMFKRVFDIIFEEQKNQVIEQLEKTGNVIGLNDEQTAKKFEPAIELVYADAFEQAI